MTLKVTPTEQLQIAVFVLQSKYELLKVKLLKEITQYHANMVSSWQILKKSDIYILTSVGNSIQKQVKVYNVSWDEILAKTNKLDTTKFCLELNPFTITSFGRFKNFIPGFTIFTYRLATLCTT